jgi:putative Mg2+ transporter-C (MgtC) family protein
VGHVNELKQHLFVGLPDADHIARVAVRLAVAVVLGGVIGFERQREGKWAGLRTHMLVSLGAALIVLAPLEAGMESADISRVIQGLVTGIGFLGGGTILKLSDERQVRGLTSAASIWLTAAVGMAVGLGMLWPALLGTILTWVILRLLHRLDRLIPKEQGGPPEEKEP